VNSHGSVCNNMWKVEQCGVVCSVVSCICSAMCYAVVLDGNGVGV